MVIKIGFDLNSSDDIEFPNRKRINCPYCLYKGIMIDYNEYFLKCQKCDGIYDEVNKNE